jgi:ribonuclease P protein component
VPKEERVSPLKVGASTSESFPRQLRLTRACEFQQVFKSNFRRADACVTILIGKKPGVCPRLGFAIARKQVPKAVGRNRLKRLFRESFRKAQHRLPDRDLVIMVRREIQLAGADTIRAAMDQHWNSIIKQCEKS